MTATPEDLREQVRARYAAAATASDPLAADCCGPASDCGTEPAFGAGLYTTDDQAALPDAARLASLGCGNPTAVAELRAGEMARRNTAEAGATNVEFRKGEIEALPLPDATVDVIISNCVVNLSVDKPAVMAEMHRVLRPGGRIGISDVVAEDRLDAGARAERGSYVGCIAGALSAEEYRAGLAAVGFTDIDVAFTHEVADGLHGAIVRAVKAGRPPGPAA